MKQLIYLIIICFIVFVNVNKAIANTIKNEILITNSFAGEKLISSKEFVQSVNRTCEDDDTCTLSKIKKSYYQQFRDLNNDEITISKLKNNIELKLKKEETQNEFLITIELISYKNNKKVDSLICYEYKNNPNDSLAVEKLYYLEDYNLWTLYFIYDLESTTTGSWIKYKINPETGKFGLDNK
ncbi:hypothetical protein H3S75_11175 [Gilliamella sp. B14384G15]|uniref:hypothetical protein n=1 Tax=unclassified Gilliamella TaxID=2685620 RepID=UPI0018DDB2B2|nr:MULTISPECIES: hypothetical protein [unclassified Gilliamella]MBI0031793.1 hypothetical protein [Gilliamella sp. B14384G15]MBI0059148.1 hypothetical protein [Gilliamella sp. B14384G12]